MALYIVTDKGLVAITGCGHAGVENMIEYGLQVTGAQRVRAIIGGLHFLGLPRERVEEAANYIAGKDPELVVGTHCTGVLGMAEIVKMLGERGKIGGVGLEITL